MREGKRFATTYCCFLLDSPLEVHPCSVAGSGKDTKNIGKKLGNEEQVVLEDAREITLMTNRKPHPVVSRF
jgi:hypothetical protein